MSNTVPVPPFRRCPSRHSPGVGDDGQTRPDQRSGYVWSVVCRWFPFSFIYRLFSERKMNDD